MVKHVFNKTRSTCPVTLAILGWLAFFSGLFVKSIGPKLMLLSAARVLPKVLCPMHRTIKNLIVSVFVSAVHRKMNEGVKFCHNHLCFLWVALLPFQG